MTFKEYSNAMSHLPLTTLRANWGKIQRNIQTDLAARYGADTGKVLLKASGKVDREGFIKVSATKQLRATASEIEAQRARDNEASKRADAKLAELASLARADKLIGVDLFALVAAKDAELEAIKSVAPELVVVPELIVRTSSGRIAEHIPAHTIEKRATAKA